MRIQLLIPIALCGGALQAQEIPSLYASKKVAVRDTLQVDTISINPHFFKVFNIQNREIDTSLYRIDFEKAQLILKNPATLQQDSIVVKYLRFPEFITRTYSALNRNSIVNNSAVLDRLYAVEADRKKPVSELFEGLTTSGSLSRGITVGNNQNAVLNSQLDLQIAGKIGADVTLKAAIKDANIPLQDNGYSQRLDEFDQVFIGLESKNWNVRAGDVNLVNNDSYFIRFTKKIQGVSVGVTLPGDDTETHFFGAGALVRGNFTQSQIRGQEGNQGPYKLRGAANELFILIISGSERVYVNGLLLQRGENNDYVMDYNAGEITFTARYPITSDMRILVEYQYTNNYFTRFTTYTGVTHKTGSFTLSGYTYTESDAKNQPLLQSLSPEQVAILAEAGDNNQLMVAPSEAPDTYSENKILYRKEMMGSATVFVYSNNPADELFNVRFSFVGANLGNYTLASADAIGKIYQYVPPVAGVPQGDYEPVVQLRAPDKLQLIAIRGMYQPSEKTELSFETSLSNQDQNLFSGMDDKDNRGVAGRVFFKQKLFTTSWSSDFFVSHDFVASQYRNVEGLYQVEFTRDWNLSEANGNQLQNVNGIYGDQSLLRSGITIDRPGKGQFQYRFERLTFKEYGTGNRHILSGNLTLGNLRLQSSGSLLHNQTDANTSVFGRLQGKSAYSFRKAWVGGTVEVEDNRQKTAAGLFTPLSQRFHSYGAFLGVGDSATVFAQVGYKFRVTDSVMDNRLQRFNTSRTYYLQSQLVASKNAQLSAFVNYRNFTRQDSALPDEPSLNTRLRYQQQIAGQFINLGSVYETLSGTLPQQDFTYVAVDPGQGVYTWKDYNNNGIQELNEFEVAAFQDEALYIRVLLPNQVFVKTHQNRFSQTLTLNFGSRANPTGLWRTLSRFYNQTSYITDRKIPRNGNNFNLNPFFTTQTDGILGLQQDFRNTLFFNRGKQRYTSSYTYLQNRLKSLLSTGAQENKLASHQLQFLHKLNETWLVTAIGTSSETESASQNFINRNYQVQAFSANPKLSYLLLQSSRFDLFYEFKAKENRLGSETLRQQRIGATWVYAAAQKISITADLQLIKNRFSGDSFSPVGYQLLEGLQPGNNVTWSILAQKQLTRFLDLNLSYFGRKSETSKTIHTGSVQLKAYF